MLFRFQFLVVLFAPLVAVRGQDTTNRTAGTTISGVVHDSIARMPLAGATVQAVAAQSIAGVVHTAISDSMGRFTLNRVPAGRYTLGFFHPMLDSLGVEAPLREIYIDGTAPVRADLAIPSAERLRMVICRPKSGADLGAVILGAVRDSRDGMPVAGASVTGEWLEYDLMAGGLVRRIKRLVATTGDNGWFAMCNVPSAGMVVLIAAHGADSTDLIEVQVPADGFARRELYLGPATIVVTADTTKRADSLALAPRRIRTGNGRLSGTVVAAVGGRPLANALISIVDGPQTRADERGEWRLTDAPVGTRMLDVRAVGYYPERRRVDVIAGAPPIRVALSTLKSVLDTVRITASRLRRRDLSGFYDRRRTRQGRYLTPDDIDKQGVLVASDIFRMMPGIRLDRAAFGESVLLMRGAFGDCTPAIYVDGSYMNLAPDDIDHWVRTKDIAGIEVYTGDNVPPQFQQGMSGCGSILIWTK